MIPQEIHRIKALLDSFLGSSKKELTETYQLQYACPRCVDDNGNGEKSKFNLEINLAMQLFNCWKCSSVHDEMHGSIIKLIKLYGNETILEEYKSIIYSFRQSKLYELHFNKDDFNIDKTFVENENVKLPTNFVSFNKNEYNNKRAIEYLEKRRIDWGIIEEFNIGYTQYDEMNKQSSSRIVIPSYNKFDELNYWTGRDFTTIQGRQKYFNPQVERKNIIFNENKIEWDMDIVLGEGPFDHIVVPNSIPLLGKVLKTDFKLYQEIFTKANANVIVWLDGDAVEDVKKIYKLLNHDRLSNKIRFIEVNGDLDPSKIHELYGKNGVISALKSAKKISEIYL